MSAYLDEAFDAYVECALWSSTWNDVPLDDDYGPDDIAPEALASMRSELTDFLDLLEQEKIDASAIEAGRMGHDFWLTRNGHGAGFWDRGLGELGDELTRWAKTYGSSDLYVGDNNKVYVT